MAETYGIAFRDCVLGDPDPGHLYSLLHSFIGGQAQDDPDLLLWMIPKLRQGSDFYPVSLLLQGHLKVACGKSNGRDVGGVEQGYGLGMNQAKQKE